MLSFPKSVSPKRNCLEGNRRYNPGDEFVRKCSERCRCQNNGQVKCVSLCPTLKPCMIDHTEKNVFVPTLNKKCQCPVKACKPIPYNGKLTDIYHIYTKDTLV